LKRLFPAFATYLAATAFFVGCVGPGGYKKPDMLPRDGVSGSRPSVYSNVMMAPRTPPGKFYHTVEPGETLYRIGKEYGVSVDAIMRANQIKDAQRIQRGQSLYIPGVAAPGTEYTGTQGSAVSRDYPSIPLFPNNGHWNYIVIHHTATREGDKAFIDKLHRDRGFGELGYHFIIDNGTRGKGNGQIEIGNRWYKQRDGAHTKADNMNHKGIGISLIGNFSETNVSDEQIHSLVYLTNQLRQHYRIPKWRIVRHRDVRGAATECPGNYFPWSKFRRMLD